MPLLPVVAIAFMCFVISSQVATCSFSVSAFMRTRMLLLLLLAVAAVAFKRTILFFGIGCYMFAATTASEDKSFRRLSRKTP